jgi:hypothetical protein
LRGKVRMGVANAKERRRKGEMHKRKGRKPKKNMG